MGDTTLTFSLRPGAAAAVAAALFALLFAGACQSPDTDVEQAEEAGVEEIVGQTVTVTGEIETIVSDDEFILDPRGFEIRRQVVTGTLVFDAEEFDPREGQTVTVRGEVVRVVLDDPNDPFDFDFDVADVQREFAIRAENVTVES